MTTAYIVLLVVVGLPILLAVVSIAFTHYTARRIEKALPPLGRSIDVPGGTVHVHEQGNGFPVLLIHGLGGNMRHYTYDVASRLATQFKVITIDRPGSGYSVRHEATAADLVTQAQTVAAVLEKLRVGPALVVGHSLGGAVALTLALEHPRHVAGLALIAPLTHLPEDSGVPAAFKALTIESPWLRKLFAWTLATPGSIAKSHAVLGQVFGPDPVPHDFPVRGGGLLSLRPSQFIAASVDMQSLPATLPSITARYNELNIPVKVLYGREDRILDWKINGQALVNKVPGATLELVNGGHMLPVTDPERTAGFIREAANQIGKDRVIASV